VSCNHPVRERIKDSRISKTKQERNIGARAEDFIEKDSQNISKDLKVSEDIAVLRNISYGKDASQKMDVYLPKSLSAKKAAQGKTKAPVIFMVHGGAWRTGDKSSQSVVENKVSRWVPRGFIFVSANYRMLPDAAPVEQSQDVIEALVFAQSKAKAWGGDPNKFILMGHSAGAHLVSLIAASPEKAFNEGALSWLGTVSLDSAALDVASIMKAKHFKFYDDAFGYDPNYWVKASPYDQLRKGTVARMAPYLGVCSLRRSDSIAQSGKFVDKVNALGGKAEVLKQDFSHKDINQQLGTDGDYTLAVESFMKKLDDKVARLLEQP
jgi:acetyl esterase/lipase